MKEYLEKYTDLLNISGRIKEIDAGYELFFNKKLKRFEVHNNSCVDSFVCLVPFLDARLIEKLILTRRENMQKFFKKLDEENEKLEAKKQNEILSDAKDKIGEIAKYSFNINRDLTTPEIQKILNI